MDVSNAWNKEVSDSFHAINVLKKTNIVLVNFPIKNINKLK